MKNMLTRNLGYKLLSLLLAVLIWVMIMNYDDPYITDTIEDIPVTIQNENEVEEKNKMFEVESGATVSVTVRGKRSVIDQLKASNFTATADFRQLSIVNAVPINVVPKRSSKYSVSDIEILTKTPEMMVLTLEDFDEQAFRVDVDIMGEVADGYYIASKSVNPSVIKISGSQKQIAKITSVVARINVSGSRESATISVSPIAYDANNYAVDSSKIMYSTDSVQVDVRILPTKEITIKISQEGELEPGYVCTELLSKPEKILIAGTEEELEKIGSYLVLPYDISGQKETSSGEIDLESYLNQHYPENEFILVEGSKTVAVTAFIEKMETKDFWIKTSEISFKNIPKGYTARFKVDGEVKVKVMGLAAVLEELTVEELHPYVDLSGYLKGTHYVSVGIDTRARVQVMSANVSVELLDETKAGE